MGRLPKVAIWVVSIIVVVVLAAFVFQKQIFTFMATKIIQQRLLSQTYKKDDGLYAGLAGTGAPFADINRVGPCIVVEAGNNLYIIDGGPGSARNIGLMGFDIGKVNAILLTHFHSDHIADLGEMMLQRWAGGSNAKPVDVIGPKGVETVVEGFNHAYSLDAGYRVAFHGAAAVPPSGAGGRARPFGLSSEEDASIVVVYKEGVKITAFKVNHYPAYPAVGYRVDYKGRSLVISGDTVPCQSLKKQAQGVDVLFHEAQQPALIKMIHDQAGLSSSPSLAKITADIPGYHTSPENAAKIANETNVKQLVLYHILPPIPPVFNHMFLGDAAKYYKGPITVGVDGLLISLPVNSKDIIFHQTVVLRGIL
ncbi:MAG TPA: MBL fold metallo-hydrolase [Smithellaceae bacterium]|nr:MBL fold metallo-hydrolase [Smithellaceae bacterium]